MIPSKTTSARSGGTNAVLDIDGPLGRFAGSLFESELPGLPDDSRAATVGFVCRRATQIPGPLRLGVTTLALGAGFAARVFGWQRVTHFVRHTQIPPLGELARLVRSLGFAYVWETWPATAADGSPTQTAVTPQHGSKRGSTL